MKKIQGSPQPLGVTISGKKTNYAVAVPTGASCDLVLFQPGEEIPFARFEMPEAESVGEVRFLALDYDKPWKYEYQYLIDGKAVPDPYARILYRKEETEQTRCGYPAPYDWEGDKVLQIPDHEVIAYSLHVRGFTMHPSSKVRKKGTFQGLAAKIPYLLELGINQIQCMPVYEFEDIQGEKVNYWGYGPAYFFALKSSYAASKNAAKEFKDLVKACHRAGIEVVLDLPFTPDTLLQTAIECLRYYIMEYHIDGFILNPYNVSLEAVRKDPYLKNTKILKKEDQFQNTMRRFLKGDEGMVGCVIDELKRNTGQDGCFNYMTNHTGFTLRDLVSYDGKHNEQNGEQNHDGPDYNYSWNCGVEGATRKKEVLTLRKNQVRNAFALLLTAQGTPCILAGDEFGNSQNGNNNVYCQDNELAWLNWNQLKKEKELFSYVKDLIAFRKNHEVLHQKEPLKGIDYTACGMPDVSYHGESAWQTPSEVASRWLGVFYSSGVFSLAETETDCYVAYNMHWQEHTMALPNLGVGKKWYLAVETGEGVLKELQPVGNQRKITLKARSVQILIGRAL